MNMKNEALSQQLTNINEYVATQSLALINEATWNNQNTTQILDLPSQVGNQVYWISIVGNSSNPSVQSGLGNTAVVSQQSGVAIPARVSASGVYTSASGRALLQCTVKNQIVTLELISE